MSPRDEPRTPRVPALDGLRGCAVVLVIAGHTAQPQWDAVGAVGVTLFFVLSGYLITTILVRERSSTGRTRFLTFYSRRARRLLPALALLLVFDTGVRLATGQSLGPVILAGLYGTNIATSLGYSSTLTHTWSLALEEQFYALWPLVLPWVWRRRHGVALLLAAAVTVAAARGVIYLTGSWTVAYFSPLTRCDAILVGCALALAVTKGWRLPWGWTAPALALALATFAAAFVWSDLTAAIILIPLASLASAVLVVGLLEPARSPLRWVLSSAPLRFTGRISYGMYLWHPFVLAPLLAAQAPHAFLATTAVTVAVAALFWVVIERPFSTPSGGKATRTRHGVRALAVSFETPALEPAARVHRLKRQVQNWFESATTGLEPRNIVVAGTPIPLLALVSPHHCDVSGYVVSHDVWAPVAGNGAGTCTDRPFRQTSTRRHDGEQQFAHTRRHAKDSVGPPGWAGGQRRGRPGGTGHLPLDPDQRAGPSARGADPSGRNRPD